LDKVAVHEAIPQGELADAAEGVLDDTHDRLVCLRRDDLPGNGGNLAQLGARLLRLRDVQVHFVAVEAAQT
jgi:hypothetical protein